MKLSQYVFYQRIYIQKNEGFFPLALEIISPLSIKQSFTTEVVPDASTHGSAFSTIGD